MAINKQVAQEARKQIGFYIEDIRKQREISKGEVCRRSGITRDQYNFIVSGKKDYTISTFFAVIQAMDYYFFLADKEGEHLNFEHMETKIDSSKAMDFKPDKNK